MEMSFERNTLDYAGARSLGSLARFLKTLRWWTLEPHPELVSDYPVPFCSAVPGQEYLVYFRWKGSLRLDLRPSAADDQFEQTWIDLAMFEAGRPKTISGGGVQEFQCPKGSPAASEDGDWLLHLVKRSAR
jgi:hypothetical protein